MTHAFRIHRTGGPEVLSWEQVEVPAPAAGEATIRHHAVGLNFIAFARYLPQTMLQGQVFVIFIITIAAAEAAVGLAIVLGLYRNFKTVNVDEINLMKW